MQNSIKNIEEGGRLKMRPGIILLLTLAAMAFLQGGLLLPLQASAAVTQIVAPASAVGTTAAASANVTVPLSTMGNKRMLVAGITLEGATAATATVTCTYGGTSLTAVPGSETGSTSALQHTYLFYMLDNTTLMNNTARALTFTVSGFTMTGNSIHYAAYDGVVQSAPTGYSSTSGNVDATGNSISLPTALVINSGDLGFVVAMTSRSGQTAARTITTPANWTSVATAAANTTAPATNRYCYTSGIVTSGDTVALTASGTSRLSESGFTLKALDTTAPVPNNDVSVTTDYNSQFVLSAFTITASFNEADFGSSVTGCEYTTNGTSWTAGTVSGAGPKYTCTATPTGLSGNLTIGMRATNSVGLTGTSTTISRTVDSAGPSDGSLSLSPGNPDNGLVWGAANDGTGSGLNHYDVYFQTGPVSPACGAGTLLYTGKQRIYIHSGLTGNTQYSYRVCATDNIGNISAGATGTTTTTARPSVVNTCGSCHGFPPVDNATRVGGTVGRFQGSHNKHTSVYECTKCHTDNMTFTHSNDNIDIAIAPGSYTRGTSFPVSNTFNPGTCNNTYCHSNGTSVSTGTVPANSSPVWGGTTTCSSCHGAPPLYQSGSPKMNNHTTTWGHKKVSGTTTARTCDTCHSSVTYSGGVYTTNDGHNDGSYSMQMSLGYTFSTTGGTCATPGNGCHGPTPGTWGVHLGCISCHDKVITRTKGRPGATLANVVGEFGLAYGHKKTGRAAVADDDCNVCHLEGNGATNQPTIYHQDGNIDLRDPWGGGETPITNLNNNQFKFQRFTTSYLAGTRYTTYAQYSSNIAQVITLKFCMRCHSAQGATNPTARSNNGGTGTATMPFGGVNLGANYTVANGASVAGGVVNVFSQFSSTNSSVHPVKAPRVKDFPTQARLNVPYNGFTRVGTAGTVAAGIMLNCFDCHNSNTAPLLTTRTISAHGTSRTAQVRGAIYSTNNTLCAACHSGYTVTGNHGAGSAMASSTGRTDEGFDNNCMNCHGSKTTAPTTAQTRPIAAQDFHGSNALLGGGLWPTINARPVAFIRSWSGTAYHRGRALAGTSGYAAGSATCGTGTCPTGGAVGDGSNRTYTPGGTY